MKDIYKHKAKMATSTLANPVLAQGTCVINCALDAGFTSTRQKRAYFAHGKQNAFSANGDASMYYAIRPRELAMRLAGTEAERKLCLPQYSGSIGLMPRVFTSLNNFPIGQLNDKDGVAFKEMMESCAKCSPEKREMMIRIMKEMIAVNLVFVGVPLTAIDSDANSSNHVAINVAGTTSVFNTSTQALEIGQTICWDVPDPTNAIKAAGKSLIPTGEPRGKILVETVGIKPNDMARYTISNLIIGQLDPNVQTAIRNSDFYKNFVHPFEPYGGYVGIKERVIGTCLSKARESAIFDILIRGH